MLHYFSFCVCRELLPKKLQVFFYAMFLVFLGLLSPTPLAIPKAPV